MGTFDLLFISVIVLLLVLIVLLIVCCVLRCSRRRNLTELRISEGQNTHVLTIKTEPDHAQQLLDQLLKRVFFQVELDADNLGELEAEHEEIELEHGSFSGSELEVSTPETSHHRKVISSPLNQTGDLTSHQQPGVSQHLHQAKEQHDEPQC